LLCRSAEQKNDNRGGYNREQIMLNIKTFKMFCIKSATKKADEIHEYFVKLEELLQQLVQEESDELKQQLLQSKTQLQTITEEKDELKNKLIEATEDIKLLQVKDDYPYMYIFNINERDIYPPKLKIGFTKNVNNRIKPFKQLHHNGKIELVVEVLNQNIRTVEHFIHSLLANFNISGEIFERHQLCTIHDYLGKQWWRSGILRVIFKVRDGPSPNNIFYRKKVEKRMVETNELLGTWETIAKAAEAEKICAAKMSRSIKNRVTFNDDYYFVLRPIASSSNLSP